MRRFLFLPALLVALLAAPAAQAAFPGANGDIAFTRNSGATADAQELWATAPGGGERPLTSNGWRDYAPTYSPDGTRIAWVSHEDGNADVWVRNADGSGEPVNLTDENTNPDTDPSWSPDGTKIVFSSTRSSQLDLYVKSADDSGTAQRITGPGAGATDPAWSPDGDTIAFESASDGNADIWAMDAGGSNVRNLTDEAPGVSSIDPSWSPDSAALVFARTTGPTHIWRMNADGTGEQQLTTDGTGQNRPTYSPDGKRIAWTRGNQLWTMGDGGAGPAMLADNVTNGTGVDWQRVAEPVDPGPTDTATPTPTPDPGKGGDGGGGGGTPPGGGAVTPFFEGGGPPAATCAKASVRFGDVEVLASCFSAKGRVNVATGRVRVNGLDLVPAGGEIAIDPEARTITSTRPVRVTAGAVPLFSGRLDWDLSRGRLELPLGDDAVVRLIRLAGTATITTDGLGRFRIAVLPRIDSIFDRFAARLGAFSGAGLRLPAITGDAVLRTDNARGLSLEALRLTAASVPIGLLELRSLALDFEPEAGNWAGSAKLKLPGPPPQVIADASVVVRDGVFERASLVAGNSLGAYGFGVRLERLALDARTDPFRFGGELALGAGPSLPGLGQLIRVDGSVAFTAGTPSELRLRGRSQVGPATGTASYTAVSTGRQDFVGDAAIALRPDVGVSAGVSGVVLPHAFTLLGNARARLLGLDLQGDGLFSSAGIAACVPVKQSTAKSAQAFRVGFGYRYSTKALELMAGSCDVAPWSPIALGGKAGTSARTAQASALASFDAGGDPGMVLEVVGEQAPPRVTVAGPGVRATTPADPGTARDGDVLFLRDAAARTTYVAIPSPRRGRWSVTLEPGSSPVTALRRGDGLPAPQVKARVTGRGHRRTLHWRLRAVPGQVVRISEEGRGAAAAIATTRKARGSARFTPADGPAGRRSIVAVVEQAGIARERLVAGRYRAPAPQRPGKPKGLTLRRRGGALQVRWRRAAGARSYRVQAQLSDGRRLLLPVAGRSLRVPAFGARESAKVSVTGIRGPYEGRAASKRIRRARR